MTRAVDGQTFLANALQTTMRPEKIGFIRIVRARGEIHSRGRNQGPQFLPRTPTSFPPFCGHPLVFGA